MKTSSPPLPGWVRALLVGQFVNSAGSLAWLYLTLYLVSARHITPGHAGLIAATYGLCLVLGNLGGGSIGDRFGLRTSSLACLATWAVSCALLPLSPLWLLTVLAAAGGLSSGAQRPLLGALLATALPPGERREVMARSRASFNAGLIVGPPLAGLLPARQLGWVFVVDAATTLVLLGVIATRCPRVERATSRVGEAPGALLRALRADPHLVALLLTVMVVDTSYRLCYTVLPLQLRDLHAPGPTYGLTISLNCVLIVLFEPRVARRLRARSPYALVSLGYALVGVGWLALGARAAVWSAMLAIAVVTAGEILYKPTATAHAADSAPAGMEGRYQSLYAAASVCGMVLSPLLGTWCYAAIGSRVWFAGAGAALLGAVVLRQITGRTAERQHLSK